jgi:hypothetical protein
MSLKYNTTLTRRDLDHCRETVLGLRTWEQEAGEPADPEIIMTSIGYVDVSSDGECAAYGRVVARFDDDGDLVETDDGDDGADSEE